MTNVKKKNAINNSFSFYVGNLDLILQVPVKMLSLFGD